MDFKKLLLPIIFFFVGMLLITIGALFKILHWKFGFVDATIFIAIGSLSVVVGSIIAIVKLLMMYKK
ncbi:hypothetical protein INR76_12970 [Marixanthomonas sp. SCSIO 43207]|uniref:hypothetical protein n=1 Tax=Marixanthomonas sp. SCSIO 43207 TaxID=2779360 RepID=UPI001CA8DDDC|nr:hypothetical protein [Marixanthomonas sp. SCSIO 43207]UAB81001.1 hypothetical protein INR76_12970 [Marixanthomonas sp. SCSIO 43207]